MNRTSQLLCAWSGLLMAGGFTIGILLAGLLPPPAASDSTREVVHFYSSHTDLKRAGFTIMMIAGAFSGLFTAAIGMQLKRLEGRAGPMTYAQLAAGAANVVVLTIGAMTMIAAAFRPDRDPAVLQGLHDLAWLFFIVYFSPLMIQMVAIGVAIVTEAGQDVYPRWVGYFNLWGAVALFTGVLPVFFKSGAFAWQGLFGFWVAATIFFGWIMVMVFTTVRAINGECASAEPASVLASASA